MAILALLQRAIETLNAMEAAADVHSFLVGDDARADLPGAVAGVPEQIFVRQDQEGIEIAVYIDPQIVAALERDQPQVRLHAGNLESTCIALEGLSHFVFLAWCAQVERNVTPLELELQAEVDKFVMTWLFLAEQGRPLAATAPMLLFQLFDAYELRHEVPADERDRYQAASRAAKGYCEGLAKRYARDQRHHRIEADVRQFCRRGLNDKLRAA
ncbi:MAG: hypothetical protein HY903_09340 [Deltaproteobacteria bacterium]|nr:hypothetical protein [Deltaproteobacteria bacterium]